jgi:uncharacterized SAM-binding protein YcdF (DUF218 family)
MSFLYSLLLKLINPAALSVLLLLAAAGFRKRKAVSRVFFWLAVAILLVCGNGWVAARLTKHLERRYLPPDPVPQADCIVVLSSGILPRIPPRPTIEIDDAGDRVLYGAYLFRQGKAPCIICTGGFSAGEISLRPAADDMADFLEMLGLPKDVIIKETLARNTHEHAKNVYPLFQQRGFKRVLLVTSAMHMPRSVGVFRRGCPGIEVIPAPTDFHVSAGIPGPWICGLVALVPTPANLARFSDTMHEYVGMAYYRVRGWM